MARSLVAQRTVDEDEVRSLSGWHDLTGGGDADEELAARGEQFLGDQHGERCANGAPQDADHLPLQLQFVELGVITGPIRASAHAAMPQMAPKVTVGIQHADSRHFPDRNRFLPPCLAQEIGGSENGGFSVAYCVSLVYG